MPPLLRSRLALVALMGVFLIPLGLSSLRGITHVLTCEQDADVPFTFDLTDTGEPVLASSQVIRRDGTEPVASGAQDLCGGLSVELKVAGGEDGRVRMSVPISNATDVPWQGTVQLQTDGVRIPVDIGEVGPGETVTDEVDLALQPGREHRIEGTLLVGP
jgi:hypothetical protein